MCTETNDLEKQSKPNINIIVEEALKIMDLDINTFKKFAGRPLTKNLTPEGCLNLNHAPGIDVIHIFKLLYLNSSDIMGHYEQERHLNRICHAVEKKEFPYKKGKVVRVYLKYFRLMRWRHENEFFSFRFRWKVRIKRWLSFLPFISYKDPFTNF